MGQWFVKHGNFLLWVESYLYQCIILYFSIPGALVNNSNKIFLNKHSSHNDPWIMHFIMPSSFLCDSHVWGSVFCRRVLAGQVPMSAALVSASLTGIGGNPNSYQWTHCFGLKADKISVCNIKCHKSNSLLRPFENMRRGPFTHRIKES